MNPLKRLHPQLSKLAAQLVYDRHREQAEKEVVEVRAVLAEMIRRGKTSQELLQVLTGGDVGGLGCEKVERTTVNNR